ncbi:hypothetical protein MKW98_002254 [Papaver atlanticum]|uniref:Uncharacterized protein n=1 Tax=Papaver atlanticum TaxID=357466 RepID=A0AAD4X2W4_9MAGN|nr:hypothetical protein MKW98_002254 [Papaver atlanticum]
MERNEGNTAGELKRFVRLKLEDLELFKVKVVWLKLLKDLDVQREEEWVREGTINYDLGNNKIIEEQTWHKVASGTSEDNASSDMQFYNVKIVDNDLQHSLATLQIYKKVKSYQVSLPAYCSSSKRQKKTSSQAGEDGQQTINARSVAARLRWEKQRQSDREKKEQLEREARLKFEQQLEIERQARAEEDIRREREQREYNERFNARPENQFIAERTKVRKVEGQRRRRLKEKEQQREKERKGLLNIRSEGFGKAIEQQEGEHINNPLDAQASTVCVGEVNLGGEPQSTEQLMRQQTQSDNIVLDDKEYRQRVLVEKQRQTQLFSQQPCTQYILGGCKARRNKAYNERKKAERASKKEPVQKVKSTKQVSSTRSAAQKARRATEKEKKAEMERMAASSEAARVQNLDLVPKARVRVQPETLYASLTKEEKYNILLRRGQIKEQVVMGQQDGVSIGGNTPKQNKMVRFLYES